MKLRDDIGTVLSDKRRELETQLQRLDGEAKRSSRTSRKGVKVAPKYRGPNGETWAGRGAMPRWLAALKKEGHKSEEFLIAKPAKIASSPTRARPKTSARRRNLIATSAKAASSRRRVRGKKFARTRK